MISIKNLRAGFGPCDVLQDVTAEAKLGEFIAVLGPNGSGKSTLLKTICGAIPPRAGSQIRIENRDIQSLGLKERARLVAYLAQERTGMPDMSVLEILEIGRAPYRGRLGKISTDGRRVIEEVVKKTKLEPLMTRNFGSLSGGEQARTLLARALVVDAPILLADEPIAALDPYYQLTTMELLSEQARSGKSVLAALHDLALAARYADRIWLLNKGKIVADGTVEETLTPENIASVYRVNVKGRANGTVIGSYAVPLE